MMETCKKQIDDTTIGSLETSYLNGMTKNKVVNQMSNDNDEDVVCDERNFINSTNCHIGVKTVSSSSSSSKSSPVRVGYRKTPLVHHKSSNKRSRTLVKIANLLAKRNSSSNDVGDDDNDLETKEVKISMVLQRMKHNNHIESPSIMRSLIHHKTHQTKHNALNEMAKRLTNMLKRSWNESANNKSAQTLVSKTLRRRSFCEECSTMNEIVTTRFETSFVNFCNVSKCENSKNLAVPNVDLSKKRTDNETPNINSVNLLSGYKLESDHCSAFSLYSKDCEKNHRVLLESGTNNSSTEPFIVPNEKPHSKSGLDEKKDNSSMIDDGATSTKFQLPILISDTLALNSYISFNPFPSYYFYTPFQATVVADSGDNKTVSDENNFYVYNFDENSSSSIVDDDAIDVDKEVEQLTKSKKSKKDRRNVRLFEPVAWTLTYGDERFFLPVYEY